jgi:hypothetical protein
MGDRVVGVVVSDRDVTRAGLEACLMLARLVVVEETGIPCAPRDYLPCPRTRGRGSSCKTDKYRKQFACSLARAREAVVVAPMRGWLK